MAKGRIKGITIELNGDATGLEKSLGGVDKSLSETQKNLNDVNRLLKLDPKNVELLTQKQKLLSGSVQDTSKRLETLKQASEQAAKTASNYDAWKSAYDPIQSEIDQTKEKLKELRNAKKEAEDTGETNTDSYQKLQAEITETNKKLRDLKKEAQAVNDEFGSPISASQYDALQREIIETEQKFNALQDEADDTNKALKNIKSRSLKDIVGSADDAKESLDDASESARHFGDVLSAELVVSGIESIASKVSEITEATKEYDRIMASLEVSSQKAGYSAEDTAASYEKLYGILADDQTTATTLSNLQQLGLSQSDLNTLIDGAVGAWATYGDSIPIDGLAEAINETIRTGTVTGNLADVLNWGAKEGETFGVTMRENTEANEEWNQSVKDCESAEDFFNLALQDAGSQAERTNLLMQMLADQGLVSLGEQWQDQNADMIAANQAQNDFTENMSEMSERLTPVLTTVKDGVNDLLETLLSMTENVDLSGVQTAIQNAFDFLINTVIPKISEFVQWARENIDWESIGEGLSTAFGTFADTVIPKIQEFVEWAMENIDWAAIGEGIGTAFDFFVNTVIPAVGDFIVFLLDNKELVIAALAGIAAGIAAIKFADLISKINGVISGSSTLISTFPKLGGAISALSNPVGWVVGAIVAAVATIALKGDEIQAILQKVDDFLQNIFAMDFKEIFGPVLGEILNGFFKNVKDVWDSIKKVFDGIIDFIRGVFTGDWERAWNGVKEIFGGIFDGLVALAKAPLNGIISILNGAINGINSLLNGLNKIQINVPDWVPFLGGKSFGINIPNIPNIPYLAKGGILSSGSAVVGEAGPELLTMAGSRAVVQPLTNGGTTNNYMSDKIEFVVEGSPVILDGKEIGRTAERYITITQRQLMAAKGGRAIRV